MKIVIRTGPDAVLSKTFGLLLLTLLANILFASTPLPWGGPNVILAAASILTLSIYILMKSHRIDDWSCLAIVLVASALLIWAALVHLFTDTPGYVRVGQISMGIGMLCVTYMATTTPGRTTLIVQATVLATSLSALFGFGVIYASDIFWPIWNVITDARPREIWNVNAGRLAGLSNGQSAMANQIAVAVPFAFATWIHGRRQGPMRNTLLFLLLVFLIWAAQATGYRSLAPALCIGGIAVIFTSLFISPELKPLIFRKLFVIALVATVGTALLLASGSDTFQRRGAAVPVPAEPLPEFTSCIEYLGVLSVPVSVSGTWSRDCKASWKSNQYARYYRLTMNREAPLNLQMSSATAKLYMQLLRGGGSNSKNLHERKEGFETIQHVHVLTPGKYTVEVATDDSGVGERFSLMARPDLTSAGTINIRDRYADIADISVQHRLHMFSVAYRYVLDHPLGSGGFFPNERHLDRNWSPELRSEFMTEDLHNHFLLILTHYGLPGLILLVFFCGGILWSVIRSVRLARRVPSVQGARLLSAVAGALTAYWLFRLFGPVGPFYTDWHHFILVGLALGMPRILSLRSRTSVT